MTVFRIKEPWVTGAACRDLDTSFFYPERGASTRPQKAICASCDVRAECLEYALTNGEKFGIWGGLAERERRAIRRRRNQDRRRTQLLEETA